MNETAKRLFAAEKIEYFGMIPFEFCKVINEPLLKRRVSFEPKTAILFLVPYYTGEHPGRNVSLYAVSRDYHIYFKELFARLESALSAFFPGYGFKGFADHSPIGETVAASRCGLGVVGEKFQLINGKYGSHVFIGEILTDAAADVFNTTEPAACPGCHRCSEMCPSPDECFSGLNQKKGELDTKTAELIASTGMIWGCDVCRTVCPLNRKAALTPIDFFYRGNLEYVTTRTLSEMSDEEFSERAYSFRGRPVITRNAAYLESVSHNQIPLELYHKTEDKSNHES
ncbi:MAG: epoxyqueuosine reductase [Clostridia bacterium]|nr:epoxyqueuosine reductase [Clostridia bacterium]